MNYFLAANKNYFYIVNITKPYEWLKILCLQKIYFCFIHESVNLVGISAPEICYITLSWNSKKSLFKKNSANLVRSFLMKVIPLTFL